MADTIRTLAELKTLFTAASSGPATDQEIRDLIVSMNVYAEIGSLAKAEITLGTGWQALDFDVAGVSERGITADIVNKWISGVPCNMELEMELLVLFRGAVSTAYDFTVFKDPAGTPVQQTRMNVMDVNILNVAQDQMVCWKTTISAQTGDVFQPAVRANGAAFTLRQGVFRVSRKGIE